MAYTPLSLCISRNSQIIGQDYSRLGSFTNTGLKGRKTLLSYDSTKGWNIVRLNKIQLLLRKIFGFYKNTHLSAVFESWKLEKANVRMFKNHPLDRRLKTLFRSSKRNLRILGNTTVNRAKIFCFPEVHGDKNYRRAAAQFINQHYRDGDIVLVEGIEAGKKERNQQVDHLNKQCLVQGWEPKKARTLMDGARQSREMIEKIISTYDELFAHIDFDKPDLSILESRKSSFISSVHQLALYFYPTGDQEDTKTRIEKYYSKLQNNEFSFKIFRYVILNLLLRLAKRQEIAFYFHLSEKDLRSILSTLFVRNRSLCLEIQKQRTEGKRVFVFAGASHFFKSTHTDPETIQEIHSLLSQDRFAFVAKKQMVTGKMLWLNKKLALNCFLRILKVR